ncbi:class I SAM-dependent methyltransferase [Clostridium bovifaecis]|uniref:Class I SAM-dependent methyltransferase n=1 Tax=Clostridium bovifaecis TaxID=2184719 RepID=A0A6I6ETM1_9CLOT|nr:class I SAM-dependent methyltransferase [Clostridium bovifaecis]
MEKEIVISMEKEIFTGEVLDIGADNYGVVYNVYKKSNKDFSVEYIDGRDKCKNIKENSYDSCVLFLSFSSIIFRTSRKVLIEKIYNYLKKDGFVYIWDIDKGYGKTFYGKINVMLPQGGAKRISVREINVLKDTSSKTTLRLLEGYFDIIEFECSDNIYYIKAQKKRRDINEETKGITGGD